MENQREIHKYEINGTGEHAVDTNELSLQSKNKKGLSVNKNEQPDISGLNEPPRRFLEDISPYALSYPLANRLYALKNPRKYQPGLVGDRVMSAKLIKMKELESEMTVLRKQLNEIHAENKLLRALQHRQDHALKKFEGTKGQLPQLIQSHSEEVRALKSKYKKVNMQNRDLEKRLRNREMELRAMQEQNQHLQQLSKDRNLGERESLREEVDSLKNILHHMELQFQEVSRRKAIEQKIHQQRIQQEMSLNKELKKSLLTAEQKIHELKTLLVENEVNFDTEKNLNSSKSPQEVKKLVTPSQRLPLISQQHQLEAVELIKETNLSSVKKLTNNRQKPCPPLVVRNIKSRVSPKEPFGFEDKKSTQYNGRETEITYGDEGETEYTYEKLSHRNLKANAHETYFTSDNFYLTLDVGACPRSNDAEENATKSNARDFKECSRGGVVDTLTEVSPKIQDMTELGTSGDRANESTDEDIRSPNPKNVEELTKAKLGASDMTDIESKCEAASITVANNEKSNLENSEVHREEGIDSSKKEKLLKALREIDQEEWTDVDTSDNGETESELPAVNKHVKPAQKIPHSFGKGKLSNDRTCSSGPSSAKSKTSPNSRNSAKPDLMHDLFGTIPKSELKLNKRKTSDPAIAMFRDVKL